ncbi:CLUMA_CG001504, isoform A [Clunio marinus]|uniref:CLUMA_CG001504, isoform A n=1 Tax=Clunio marinus TaxID=568069 RepID=A0A1J1HJI0_9DIPT|nr:CLUMA_CG001504, isoform A [Clunio marinus]
MNFMWYKCLFSFKILLLISFLIRNNNASISVTFLEPPGSAHVLPEVGNFGYTIEKMNIYCYRGRDKDISSLLQSITMNIDIDSDDFNCFSGVSPAEVEKAHVNHKSIFSFNFLSRRKKRVLYLNPFNQTCIGIETAEEYQVSLNNIRVDLFKFILLSAGIIIFFSASSFSRNSAFFYLCGILLGNFASVLVLIWFLSKLFPRKPLMYGVLASGWTLAAYIGQIIIDNLQAILISYQKHVMVYILLTSCISFGVCYYKGPPNSTRSQNLIKWSLQLLALLSIFFSSDYHEATLGIIAISLGLYYFPYGIFKGISRVWRRWFPPKPRLLSVEEFEEQGRVETEKALKELREYVKSPKCKEQWKLVMNLSQPTRFASFVEGEDHLTMDETTQYENGIELSDDDDEEDLSENECEEKVEEPVKSRTTPVQNGNKRYQSFNKSAHVSSSTPTSRIQPRRRATQNNSYYDLSDDE